MSNVNENQGQAGKQSGQENRITVSIRYQANSASVTINKNASLKALLEKAVEELGQDLSQIDRFQLKLESQVLDLNKKVNDYPIEEGTVLKLSLMAGGGGNYGKH